MGTERRSHRRVGTSTADRKYVLPYRAGFNRAASAGTGSRSSGSRRTGSYRTGSWSLFPRRIEPTRAQAAEESIRRTETLPSIRHPIAMVDENVG